MPSKTATWDRDGWPRATVTLHELDAVNGTNWFECVVDGIEGLAPQRTTSADERKRGIKEIDPPTVRSRDVDELIDLAIEATDVAVASTLGDSGSMGDILMVRYKTATAVRGALEALGVDA